MTAALQNVDTLRQYLSRHAPFLSPKEGRASGHDGLDRLLGGFPIGAISVLTGLAGSGRMTLAAHVAAEETKRGRPVAWIDARGTLYPPALAAHGVELSRVLMIRGARAQSVYAADQIVESGAFPVVIATGFDGLLDSTRARRLQTASEGAQVSTLLILDPPAASNLTCAALKLHLTRRARNITVDVEKDRSGRATGRRTVIEGGRSEASVLRSARDGVGLAEGVIRLNTARAVLRSGSKLRTTRAQSALATAG